MLRLKSALLVFVLSILARPSFGADARALDRIFAGKASGETASLLVVLHDQADLAGAAALRGPERRRFVFEALRTAADASQADLRRRLAEAGVRFQSFYLVNMIEVESDRALAEELAARDDVALVAANRPARLADPRPPEAAIQPLSESAIEASLDLVHAPAVWDLGFTGQGVVVGVADTGMEWEHPALKNRYRGFDGTSASHAYNWHDSIHDAAAGNPCGSDCARAVRRQRSRLARDAGPRWARTAARTAIGMAPGARWIGCRNMDRGNGTPARYTECFQFFLAPTDSAGANPRPELGADVINNSWGCPASEGCTDPDVLRAVVENVRAAGIFVAVAAGNGGPACSTIQTVPEFYEASFSVGATTLVDTIAGFSSRGPVTVDGSNRVKPDVVAPGVSIRSSVPGGGLLPLLRDFHGDAARRRGRRAALVRGAVARESRSRDRGAPALDGGAAHLDRRVRRRVRVGPCRTRSSAGEGSTSAAAVAAARASEPPPPPAPAPARDPAAARLEGDRAPALSRPPGRRPSAG